MVGAHQAAVVPLMDGLPLAHFLLLLMAYPLLLQLARPLSWTEAVAVALREGQPKVDWLKASLALR